MISYENIIQTSTPSRCSQIETDGIEKNETIKC